MSGSLSPLRAALIRGLRDGLGVEDIAMRTGHPVDDLRREVANARKAGVLPLIYAPQNLGGEA